MGNLKAMPVEIKWHPGLPIFASEPFLKAVGDEYGWIGGIDDSGQLRCVLPYTVIRKLGFRMIRFRVETIPLGPQFDVGEERTFLDSAVRYLRGTGTDMIIPATTNSIFRCYPEGAVAAPYGTYVIDLQQPEETLWKNVHPKNRTAIRNSTKKGVIIRSGMEYLDAAYAQVRDTFRRSGFSFMSSIAFQRMLSGAGDNVKIFVADYQGMIQGCTVNFFSRHSAYSVYAGSLPKPVDGATKQLHWEAIRLFRDLGVGHYDFVGARVNPEKGSKQEKLMLYKRQLGAHLRQGYIWKYSLRPVKFALYCLAVRLLQGGDIVDQEHRKLATEALSSSSSNQTNAAGSTKSLDDLTSNA
jgi:hypothetical protein